MSESHRLHGAYDFNTRITVLEDQVTALSKLVLELQAELAQYKQLQWWPYPCIPFTPLPPVSTSDGVTNPVW